MKSPKSKIVNLSAIRLIDLSARSALWNRDDCLNDGTCHAEEPYDRLSVVRSPENESTPNNTTLRHLYGYK